MKKKSCELAKAAYRAAENRGAFETHPARMLRKENSLLTRRLVSVPKHILLSFPELRRNATWIFPFGRAAAAGQREKKSGQEPGYLGPQSHWPQLWKVAPVLWTSPSCPHHEVARISSHSVFTTLDGPKARMGLASSSKTRCSPLGGFHFPRISLSTCSGRLLEHQPLSTFPCLVPEPALSS